MNNKNRPKHIANWLKKILLLIVSLTTIFFVGEAITQLLPPSLPEKIASSGKFSDVFKNIKYKTSAGYRLRPNIEVILKKRNQYKQDVTFKTNSLGYRHNTEIGNKQTNDYRILILGDSIMLADYAHYHHTIPHFIQESIRPHSRKRIEVINTSIGGIALDNEIAILKETGLATKPDIVVVGLYLNDAKTSLHLRTDVPSFLSWSKFARLLAAKINIVKLAFSVKKEIGMAKAKTQFQNKFKYEKGDWRKSKVTCSHLHNSISS